MSTLPNFRTFTAAATGTGVSTSYALGLNTDPMVPVSVLFPASLQGTTRLKFQVSRDDSTYVDLYSSTALLYMIATAGVLVAIPDIVQQLCLGWDYIRVAALDGSNVLKVPAADYTVTLRFCPLELDNASVTEPNGIGVVPGFISGTQGTLTDRSGTITLGGTAQTLAAANATRKYLIVENVSQTEDLWINFTTTAVVGQPSLLIKPNGVFVMESSFVSTELVSVIAATTSHAWAAKEA